MPRDVGKGLDLKRDKREMSCTAGVELYRGRQDMPRETRHTVEGGSEAEGMVKQSGVRGFPLQSMSIVVAYYCLPITIYSPLY